MPSEEETLCAAVEDAERLGRLNHRRLDALSALANFYTQQGRLRDAEPLWVQILSLQEKIFGPEHQKLAAPMVDLSRSYERMGRFAEAEAVLLLALKIHERDAVQNSAQVAEDLMALGLLSLRRNINVGAEARVTRAFNIARIIYGEDRPLMAKFLLTQAEFHQLSGRFDLARKTLLKAVEIFHRTSGDLHPTTLEAWTRLGHLEKAQLHFRDATAHYRHVLTSHLKAKRNGERVVGDILFHWGELLLAEGKPKAGIKKVHESLDILEKRGGSQHPDVAEAVLLLAEIQAMLHDFEEAETHFLRAWDVYEKTLGSDAPGLLRTQTGLAALYFDRACYDEADRLFAQLTQSYERIFGPHHPSVRASLMNQLISLEAQDRMDEAKAIRQRLAAEAIVEERRGTHIKGEIT